MMTQDIFGFQSPAPPARCLSHMLAFCRRRPPAVTL
jgi:hypothetical protein